MPEEWQLRDLEMSPVSFLREENEFMTGVSLVNAGDSVAARDGVSHEQRNEADHKGGQPPPVQIINQYCFRGG